MRHLISAAVVILAVAAGTLAATGAAQAAPACLPTLFTVVGSGEAFANKTTVDEVARGLRDQMRAVGYSKVGVVPIDYPAVPWNRYIKLNSLILPNWAGLTASETVGVNHLKQAIKSRLAVCPSGNFAFAGYSQGADVIARTLQDPEMTRLPFSGQIAVMLGDPSFTTFRFPNGQYDGHGTFDPKKKGIRVATRIAGAYTDNHTMPNDNGVGWHTRRFYVEEYCNAGDPVCNFAIGNARGVLPGGAHLRYAQSGLAYQAGKDVVGGFGVFQ